MGDSALSVANYFIDLAKRDGVEIKPLKLMKLVYIAHGFMLAFMNRSVINPRFDKVEAWKYGPVIPSVYHSFKQYGNCAIDKKTVIFFFDGEPDKDPIVRTPELKDEEAKKVCNIVWRRYSPMSDSKLVTLLHGAGTPWAMVYKEGENRAIPDEFTRLYYKGLIRILIENGKNREK